MSSNGHFLYPPDDNDVLWYNYVDTIDVSWETLQMNATECYLTLWYYIDGQSWTTSYNETVPFNGSARVNLNIVPSKYYGQFNFNYTIADGGHSGLYLSQFFNVERNPSQTPVNWPISATTSSISLGASQSTSSIRPTSSSSPLSPTSTPPTSASPTSASTQQSQQQHSGISSGTFTRICVGVLVPAGALVVLFALFFFFSKRRVKRPAASMFKKLPPEPGNHDSQLREPAELQTWKKPNQLYGSGETWELSAEEHRP